MSKVASLVPVSSQLPQNQSSGTTVQSQSDQSFVQIPVSMGVVKDVSEFDFPQAQKTWEALEQAGLEAGRLVVGALHRGLGYELTSLQTQQYFIQKEDQTLLGENKISDEQLVGYSYQHSNQPNQLPLLEAGVTNSLVLSHQELASHQTHITPLKQIVRLWGVVKVRRGKIAGSDY